MQMKRMLALALAGALVLALSGCQKEEVSASDPEPESSSQAAPAREEVPPEGSQEEPPFDPASPYFKGSWEDAVEHYHQYRTETSRSEDDIFFRGMEQPPTPGEALDIDPEGGEPIRIVMRVQEYHSGSDEVGNEDRCVAEIPRIEGGIPGSSQVERLNHPLVWLEDSWNEFRTTSHGGGVGMAIHSYPYSNSRWTQVVVHRKVWPSYGYSGDMYSANYDLETRQAVTIEEMLDRLGISQEELLKRVAGAGTARLLGMHNPDDPLVAVKCRAFRAREDGSAVFFLLAVHHDALFLSDAPPRLLAYDSRDGSVTRIWDKLGGGAEPPDTLDPPLKNAEVD